MDNMRLNMLREMLKGLSDDEKLELFKEASNLELSLNTEEGRLKSLDDCPSHIIEPKLEGLDPDKEGLQAGNIDWSDLATIKPEPPSAFVGIPMPDEPPSSIIGLDPDEGEALLISNNYGYCKVCNRNTSTKDEENNSICSKECYNRLHKKSNIGLTDEEIEQSGAFGDTSKKEYYPSSPPSSIMGFGAPQPKSKQDNITPIWTEENYLFGSNTRLMNIATEIYNSNQRTKLTTKKNQDPNIFRHISGCRLNHLKKYQLDMGYNKPDDLFAIRFCTKDPSLSKTSERFDVPLSELSIKRNVSDFTNYDYRREGRPPVKEIILKFEDSSNSNTTVGEFLTALNYMEFYHKALRIDMRHIEALINKSKNDRTDNKRAILNDRSLLLLDPSFKLETNVDIFINNLYIERRGEVHQHQFLYSDESETKDISKLMESYRENKNRLDRAYSIYRERGTITLIHSLLPYEGYLEIEGNKVKVSSRFYDDYREVYSQNSIYKKFIAKLEDNGNFMLS